jgi:hypothetical protein
VANVNKARGLWPVTSPQGSVQARLYEIAASYATNLFKGDPVVRASTGYITVASAGAGAATVLGAILAVYDHTMKPIDYWVASTSTKGYALVADDPDQEFIIQEDSDGGALALADRGQNANLVAGTGDSTYGTFLSGWLIDSSTKNTTATLDLKLIDKLNVQGNDFGNYCDWVVKINAHQNASATAGI